jgi:hypothetical protein
MGVNMSHRIFIFKWVPLYVMAVLLLAALPFVGQTPTPAAKKATVTKGYTAPRTPDGKPDLQGVWNSATLTPLTRPKEFANKEFFTPEEAAAFEKSELQSVDADRRDGGAAADIGRAYNEFWRDRGKVSPELRTSLVIDPPDGKIPPLTPQGQKLAAQRRDQNKGKQFDGPENRSLAERCISVRNAGPPMIPTNYNSNYQIVQTPGRVALLSEQIHDLRIIRTDGSPHIPSSVRQLLGDSIGHWEGETLVVETTNFTDQTAYQDSGEHMVLIERFTRTGPETMYYEFTVNDPESFTKPWTARIPMIKTSDQIFEYACHEGNYGLAGSLSGARAEEKAAAEGKGPGNAQDGKGKAKGKQGK